MFKLGSRENLLNQEKAVRALKTSAKNASKVHLDTSKYPLNPIDIKTEILKTVDDASVCKITAGGYALFYLSITSDEKYGVATNTRDITILDLVAKSVHHTLQFAHTSHIVYLGITKKDDRLISVSSDDGCVKIWDFDLTRLKKIQLLSKSDLNMKIKNAVLSSDNTYLLVVAEQGINFWDLAEKKITQTIPNPNNERIYSINVSKDGKYLACTSVEKSIFLWNINDKSLTHYFKNAHYGVVRSVKFSEDDQFLYSECTDCSISIWDLKEKRNIHTFLNAHSQVVVGYNVLKGNRFLLSASQDCTIAVWDIETKTHLHSFKNINQEPLASMIITNDSQLAIATGRKGSVFFINLDYKQDTYFLKDVHEKLIDDLKVTHDGKFLITGADDGRICIWNLETKELYCEFKKEAPKEIWKIAISPDDQKIASTCSDGTVDLWDIPEKKHIRSYEEKHRGGASCVIFTKDSTRLLSSCHGPHIFIHEVNSPKLFGKIENAHKSWVVRLDITKDDQYVVSGSLDKSIAIWELSTKTLVHRFHNAHDANIWSLRLTNDNKFLISGSSDRTVKIWDFETRRLSYVLETSHETAIKGIDVSSDDTFLVSTDYNCNLEIHNLKTKQRAYVHQELRGQKSLGAAISRDCKYIYFIRENSIHVLENAFNKLTVQYSDDCPAYSLLRFMPLTSYFENMSPEHRKRIIKSYPGLKVHPYGWNWFHITAIYSPNKETIQACLESQIPFTQDIFGNTPLHYLIENEEAEMNSLNLILSKFEVILQRSQRSFELLNSLSDIVFDILELDNSHVVTLLNLCMREPEPEFKEAIDIYGKTLGHRNLAFYPSKSMLYSQRTRENLITYSHRQKVTIQILPFNWAYHLTSDDMRYFVKTMKELSHQGIFESKVIGLLINYLWKSSKNFNYVMGVIFSIQAILICIYTGIGEHIGLEIAIFIIAAFFLIYEIFEILSDELREHFSSVWNHIDMVWNILVPGTLIAIWCGLEGEVKHWLFSFILSFTFIRWISYFRVFKQTRRLIRMIIEIMKDIRSFGIVISFIIFGLSLIFYQFERETSYGMHLLNAYRLLYSDFDVDDLKVSPAKIFYFVIVIAILSIILLNMLITIMGNTFAEVQSRAVIVDSKELLEMIHENIKVYRVLKNLTSRRKVHSKEDETKFLFYAEQKVEEVLTSEERLEDHIKVLQSQLNTKNDEIGELKKKLEEQKEMQMQQFRMIQQLTQILEKTEVNGKGAL